MATPTPTSPQDQNVSTANLIGTTLGNTIRRNPEGSAAVIQSGNPNNALPLAAATQFAGHAQALVQHQQNYNSGGLLQTAMNDVTSVASKVTGVLGHIPGVSTLMNWANKPLQEIQKDYKFVSAVYNTKGLGMGLLATAGVLAGTGLGAAFGGPVGAAAGTDLAMAAERNIFGRLVPEFHAALKMSDDPNYKVSFGRELASGLSNIPGFGSLRDTQHGVGQFVSGVTDAAADLTLDPVIVGGRLSAGVKSGEFIKPQFSDKATVQYAKDANGKFLYQTADSINNPVNLFHGTHAVLKPGDIINPSLSPIGETFATSSYKDAYAYAMSKAKQNDVKGKVYRVEPIEGDSSFKMDDGGTGPAHSSKQGFRVVEHVASTKIPKTTDEISKVREGYTPVVYKHSNSKVAIPIATDGYAQSASGIQQWLIKRSGVASTPQGLLDTYDLAKSQQATTKLGKVGQTLNPIPARDAVATAFDHIGTMTNPVEIAQQYPDLARQITPRVMARLAEVKTGRQVAETLAQALHSAEISDDGVLSTITNLNLPTRTLGRALYGNFASKIREKAGDTTVQQEPNLIFPKKVTAFDDKGNVLKNEDGTNKVTYLKGGLIPGYKDGKITSDWAKAVNGKIRTFTGYKALSVNAANLTQSAKEINLSSPDAAPALYNMARYTLGHQVALDKVAKIILEPDKGIQARLYGSLVKEVLKAGGISEDSNVLNHVMSEAQRFTSSGSPTEHVYGASIDATPLGQMKNKETVSLEGSADEGIPEADSQNYAIWAHQHGSHGIIDFKALRREMQNANLYNKTYLKADDFFTAYTEKIFAPLTLFTTGFGIRVAANEALHQVIRNGLGDYIENRVVASGVKFSSKPEIRAAASKIVEGLTDEDLNSIDKNKLIRQNSVTKHVDLSYKTQASLAMKNPVGFASYKIAPYLAADKVNFMAKFQGLFAGMTLPAASSSSHMARYGNAAAEEIDQGMQQLVHGRVPGQKIFGLFPVTDPDHMRFWALGLQKLRHEDAARDIAMDWLNNTTKAKFNALTPDKQWQEMARQHATRVANPKNYADVRVSSAGMKNVEPEEFAGNQVADFRRQVTGADGTVHKDIIGNIFNGKPTYANDLKDIPQLSRPKVVLGQINRPTMSNPLERVIETGYRTFINPVVDYISREPIFNHYAYENYRSLKPMVDSGLLTDDQAIIQAAQKGMAQMIPLIHNPPLRSQFAMIHRNLMPFYFAQEQAMKRVGRLIQSNPHAFREFQMIQQGLNNPGFVHQDSTGNKYIVYPLLGHFGNMLAHGLNTLGMTQFDGLPSTVTGSTSSLLSVFPEMKLSSVGPFANMALGEMTKVFPALAPADSALTGGYPTTDWISALMPSSGVRDFYEALTMNDKTNAVHNSFMSAVAAGYYNGDIPDGRNGTVSYALLPPAEKQAIMDKIENNARTNLFVKGIMAFFLPLAPSVNNDTYNKDMQTLRSEFVNMTLPQSQGGLGMDLKTATAEFMNKYGAQSVVYTQSKTASGAGGASLPLAKTTIDWLANNQDIMKVYPNGAAYLVPQNSQVGSDALKIEQKLLSMHLRETMSPKDFVDATFVAKGWSDMGPSLADYEALLKSAGNNKALAGMATSAWQAYTAEYGQSNPIWYADYKDPTRTAYAYKSLSDLQKLNETEKLGTSAQASGIKGLLASYKDYHAALQQNTIKGMNRVTPMYSQIKNAWFDYITQLSTTNPELTNVINGVFKKVV